MWGLLAAIAVVSLAMWEINRARRTLMAEQEPAARKRRACEHRCCHCTSDP